MCRMMCLLIYRKKILVDQGYSSVVECLSRMHKALDSIPSRRKGETEKGRREEEKERRERGREGKEK
jgi:hypothetical protein